ncbi:hypothetical protein Sjap_023339 [Stephania japonica]|uniref:Uncharacterized protein n=1 Tax=Stephania japonica TaxID=461633 RepID=A0AAP0HMK7_9MAGN
MLRFCCKDFIFRITRPSTVPNRLFFSVLTKPLKPSSDSENQSSHTVSYLTKSCGLSPKSALLASKKLNIRSTKNSDSVIDLFRENGFTDAQIMVFINKRPRVLLSRPETIKPKFEFLKSLMVSNDELWSLLWREPLILIRSLKAMVSNVDFVRNLVHNEGDVLVVVKQLYRARLLVIQASALMLNVNRFKASVVAAEKLGFNPKRVGFLLAVRTMIVVSESSWDQKMRTFKSTGWTEDEIFAAFKVQPMMMLTSDKKIRKLMDFFRDKLGCETAIVAKSPDSHVPQVMKLTAKSFMEKFVIKYRDVVPNVEKAHRGEVPFHGFSRECKYGMLKVGVRSTSAMQNVVS